MHLHRLALLYTLAISATPALAAEPDRDDLPLPTSASPAVNDAGLEMPTIAKPEPVGAGLHERLETFHDADMTYGLYIPDAVAAASAKDETYRAPSLIVQNPGGRPGKNMLKYRDWADRRGVILVGIDKVSNGMPQHEKPRYQDAVLKDLDARGVPQHPHLRYTIGMSGGAADGERMARRQGKRFAGIVLQGAGGVPKSDDTKHLAIAILGGAKDPIFQGVQKRYELAKERGNPVRMIIEPERAHEWAPIEQQIEMLDWMLGLTKLTNPYLSDAERAAYREEALEQMKAATEIEDPAARLAEATRLLRLEPLRDMPEYQHLTTAWVEAAEAEAKKIENPADQYAFLRGLVDGEVQAAISPVALGRLEVVTATLRQQPGVAEDWKLRTAYHEARDMETRAGLDKAAMTEAIAAYQRLATEAADSPWGERAAADAARLTKIVSK